MKNFLKSHWKPLLFFTLSGILGGFCCGLYLLDSYPPEIVQQITDQGLTPFLAGVVSAYQAAGYGLVLGALGIVRTVQRPYARLAQRVGQVPKGFQLFQRFKQTGITPDQFLHVSSISRRRD